MIGTCRLDGPHVDGRAGGVLGLSLVLAGCGLANDSPTPLAVNPSTVTTTGAGGSHATSAAATTGSSAVAGGLCSSPDSYELLEEKRIVRLTFGQLVMSVRALFGDELADELIPDIGVPGPKSRTFPPIYSPWEGNTVTESVWPTTDFIAQRVREHAEGHFDELTGPCTDSPSQCAEQALLGLAERAYRRPVAADEAERLLSLFEDVLGLDASVPEAFGYGVYAIVSAPQYLYRTEFGSDPEAEGPLTDYELASQLSYFLTEGPPDPELLQAAADGSLSNDDVLTAQTERLLAASTTQQNLSDAVYSLFGLGRVSNVIIDPAVAPEFDAALRSSMMREAELFVGRTLWNEPVNRLLTSRTSFVDESLAALYDVPYVADGADSEGFVQTELPEERAGLLTNAAFLTGTSRPDGVGVPPRGCATQAALVCATNPAFPENLAASVEAIATMLEAADERDKMNFRLSEPACAGCHRIFDPLGYILYSYDVIGRYRTTDPEGRPISQGVEFWDGTLVGDAPELAQYLVDNEAFTRCMARQFLSYALQTPRPEDTCVVSEVMDSFNESDQTFADLMREIVRAPAFRERSAAQSP